jgi:hypothetical protein
MLKTVLINFGTSVEYYRRARRAWGRVLVFVHRKSIAAAKLDQQLNDHAAWHEFRYRNHSVGEEVQGDNRDLSSSS